MTFEEPPAAPGSDGSDGCFLLSSISTVLSFVYACKREDPSESSVNLPKPRMEHMQ